VMARLGGLAAVLAVLLAFAPVAPALIVGVGALGVAAGVALAIVRDVQRATERPTVAAAPEPPRATSPDELRWVARALDGGVRSELELDRSLRPILRTIARTRLAARGIDLDRDGERVAALLDPDLAELVGRDRDLTVNRLAPGWRPEQVRQAIDRLETL
jgi:hypothetical protein